MVASSSLMVKLMMMLFVLWLSLLVNESTSRALYQTPYDISAQIDTSQDVGTSFLLNQSIPRSLQLKPVFDFDEAFIYKGPWTENQKNMLLAAVYGVDDMALAVVHRLIEIGKAEDEPSFMRYFYPANLPMVIKVFENVMGYTGTPGTEEIRKCYLAHLSGLELWLGDIPFHSADGFSCDKPTLVAYHGVYSDITGRHPYIVFCELYFLTYRSHVPMTYDPSIPHANPAYMGNNIDALLPDGNTINTQSGASILLHELLHWNDLTARAVGTPDVRDAVIQRPGTNEETKAYRSFYAMKMKDMAWRPRTVPIYNDDSYVSMAREIYYSQVFGRTEPWADAIDPVALGEIPGPG